VPRHLPHQHLPLPRRRKVDAALQHAAAVPVRRDLDAVAHGCIVHKLAVLWAQPLQAALDDVVAVQVLDQRHDAGGEGLDYYRALLRTGEGLDQLLDRSGAVRVEGDGDEVALFGYALEELLVGVWFGWGWLGFELGVARVCVCVYV